MKRCSRSCPPLVDRQACSPRLRIRPYVRYTRCCATLRYATLRLLVVLWIIFTTEAIAVLPSRKKSKTKKKTSEIKKNKKKRNRNLFKENEEIYVLSYVFFPPGFRPAPAFFFERVLVNSQASSNSCLLVLHGVMLAGQHFSAVLCVRIVSALSIQLSWRATARRGVVRCS